MHRARLGVSGHDLQQLILFLRDEQGDDIWMVLARNLLNGIDLSSMSLLSANIRELDLYGNALTPRQMQQISSGLQNNNTLRFLDLSSNGIEDAHTEHISTLIRHNKKIRYIFLHEGFIPQSASFPALGREGFAAIANGLRNDSTLLGLTVGSERVSHAGPRFQAMMQMLIDALNANVASVLCFVVLNGCEVGDDDPRRYRNWRMAFEGPPLFGASETENELSNILSLNGKYARQIENFCTNYNAQEAAHFEPITNVLGFLTHNNSEISNRFDNIFQLLVNNLVFILPRNNDDEDDGGHDDNDSGGVNN